MTEKPVKRVRAEENVVRYVGGASYDPVTKEVDGGAFGRKPKDTDGLSFTIRMILDSDSESDKNRIREIFSTHIKVGKTAIFAELNVGDVEEALEEFGDGFFFQHDPLPEDGEKLANPAHAILNGLPFIGEAAGSLKSEYAGDLLKNLVLDKFPAALDLKNQQTLAE